MSKRNNTLKIKNNQYRHLKEEDRIAIQVLVSQKEKMLKKYTIIAISLII